MKQLLFFLLLISTTAHSQTRYPFGSKHKNIKTITLTNGKYDEFFDEDTLQRVGSSVININTKKITKVKLTQEEIDELENEQASRFLSVDPLTSKFAMLTPYQYASNNPIAGIDLDGLEFYYAADGKLLGKLGTETRIKIVSNDFTTAFANSNSKMTWKTFFQKLNSNAALVDKTGAIRILNEFSLETYNNKDDAAADFSLKNGSMSIVANQEYAARIGSVKLEDKDKTVFILGSTVTGFPGSGEADINKSNLYGTKLAAGTHTHGKDPRIPGVHVNNFSGKDLAENFGQSGDMDWAWSNHVPIYLANPKGELRVYEPKNQYTMGDEYGILIRSDMPFDIYCSGGDKNNQRPAYDYNKIVYEQHREPRQDEAIPYKLPGRSF